MAIYNYAAQLPKGATPGDALELRIVGKGTILRSLMPCTREDGQYCDPTLVMGLAFFQTDRRQNESEVRLESDTMILGRICSLGYLGHGC